MGNVLKQPKTRFKQSFGQILFKFPQKKCIPHELDKLLFTTKTKIFLIQDKYLNYIAIIKLLNVL